MANFIKKLISFPAAMAVLLIKAYQLLLSPDHSWLKARYPYGYCRHYPSCSEYSRQAVVKFGLIRGLFLGSKRILKCNPWSEAKVDLLPNE
ncbi:MAG: membrane protein insertion efficiency factor YidD [Patescibacteria group bacterium]|nr:membrane protein insertion efficiency factor YidD [Patescibacteria group bacterium]